ncbi:hypothetical protein AGABI1DRAFT_132530 [Agaricus bisporus var. burnettii JB137-S8]|uniref:Uncharacterized protein n=1 Tax=Agaricus bisporus var. burnettii (strain JB137-S8 / ATCC MYA-4627 / FGSC 10392) TaxID=597362 RepID=K5VLC4_AGABU|nr:uncharacterized protein AGABI1DRAFT_132530 [Agaricus bisporus var. burnettii JB137-S8]EKM75179.1 hypothetical protein AGABI1DRAFT_132530 [Agaricus bisporus var. burnettii JB137-S8]
MSYEQNLAQTLEDIDDVLRQGSELLASGQAASESLPAGDADGELPSTSYGHIDDGNRNNTASEHDTRESRDSPRLSYADDGDIEPAEAADRAPKLPSDGPASNASQEDDGNDIQDNQHGRRLSWSDYDEDDGDIGPIPSFDNGGDTDPPNALSEQSRDEYDFVHRRNNMKIEDNFHKAQICALLDEIKARDEELADLRELVTARREESTSESPNSSAPQRNSRFIRASSSLPPTSQLRRAMTGGPGGKSRATQKAPDSSAPRRSALNPHQDTSVSNNRHSSFDDDEFVGPGLFDDEPESDHESDSKEIRDAKREQRRRHRARLKKLQYQAHFIKNDPPFASLSVCFPHQLLYVLARVRLQLARGQQARDD